MIHFQKMRSRRLSFLKNFLKLTVSHGINLQFLNMKFQEKIFTTIKIIQLWNFGNFGMPEIIPKNLVTLRFLKFLYQVLTGTCKMFQMRYWPNFYVDPTYSNAYLFKLDKWRVYLQATVDVVNIWNDICRRKIEWIYLYIMGLHTANHRSIVRATVM